MSQERVDRSGCEIVDSDGGGYVWDCPPEGGWLDPMLLALLFGIMIGMLALGSSDQGRRW